MTQFKCTECGQIFDGNLKECPNCGCPASERKSMNNSSDEPDFITTDTGYQHEKIIKRYADVIWIISIIFAAVILIVPNLICLTMLFVGEFSLTGLVIAVGGTLSALLLVIFGILAKAFLYIYANISINIHEINMKTK